MPFTPVCANEIGQTITLNSKHLAQSRKIVISLPSNYADEPFYRFPVLYLTDASSQFDHTASMIHYLSDGISPMIVVGVFTPERWQELKPYTMKQQLNPQAENLRKFIVEEVKPYINENYRTVDFSMFAGHSLGGSFAANAYIQGPDDFDVFFALAPNFALGNEVMFKLMADTFKLEKQPRLYFMFEGISPFITPINSYAQLSNMLLKHPHLQATHQARLLEGEDHMTVPHIGLYRALSEIYKDWFLYIPAILEDKTVLKTHFQKLSKRIGYQVNPTEFYYRDLVDALLNMKQIESAAYVAQIAKETYPKSHFSYVILADVAHAQQNASNEMVYLKRAIELAEDDHQRQSQYQKRLSRL